MASRKQLVKNRADLANKLAKLEVGKSQIKVGDAREFLKRFVQFEATGILTARKSAFIMLRKEAVALAKKHYAKKHKKPMNWR
jgi:hypothetical protein